MIEPISIPDAAGVDYGGNDVRHVAPGDEMSVVSLNRTTRNLASRDNRLGQKLNEVIAKVNSSEQLLNLPAIRTIVPPATAIVVANYRVPNGFEVRIINAAVATNPVGVGAVLSVFHNDSFGGEAGTEIVTTTSEAEIQTQFYGRGELVVRLSNSGTVAAELVASVVISMRAVLEIAGDPITSGPKDGTNGTAGKDGKPGRPGTPGSAGTSGKSFNWRGTWTSLISGYSFVVGDVVGHAITKDVLSATRVTTTATVTVTAHGLIVGQRVTVAGVEISGNPTNSYNGTFTVVSVPTVDTFTYTMASDPGASADASTGTISGMTGQSAYVAKLAHVKGSTTPDQDATNWDLMVEGGSFGGEGAIGSDGTTSRPTYGVTSVALDIHTNSDYVGFSRSITSITRVTTTATVTLTAHLYVVDQLVTISGATGADGTFYNGTFAVASTPTADTFTYVMTGTPSGSAAGTLLLSGEDGYVGGGTASADITVSGFKETFIQNATGTPSGVALLNGMTQAYFSGSLLVTLPTIVGESTKVDWLVANAMLNAVSHGILPDETNTNPTVRVEKVITATNQFKVTSLTASPSKILLGLVGISTIA